MGPRTTDSGSARETSAVTGSPYDFNRGMRDAGVQGPGWPPAARLRRAGISWKVGQGLFEFLLGWPAAAHDDWVRALTLDQPGLLRQGRFRDLEPDNHARAVPAA